MNSIQFPTASGTVKGDGSGETIALVEAYHEANLQTNLQTFDTAFGLPAPSLTVVDQAGNLGNPSWSWRSLWTLKSAYAIAPGAAIVVVEAKSQSLKNMMAAVKTAKNIARGCGRLHELGVRRICWAGLGKRGVHHTSRTHGHHVRGRQRR